MVYMKRNYIERGRLGTSSEKSSVFGAKID